MTAASGSSSRVGSAPVFHASTLMDLARVLRAAGKTTNAGDAAREALGMLERKGDLAGASDVRAFTASLG